MKFIHTFFILLMLTGCATMGGEAESAVGKSSIDFQETQSTPNLIITYTAHITITSKDIKKSLENIKNIFSTYDGYSTDEQIYDNYIRVTYKISTTELNSFMELLDTNYNIKSSSIYSTDITNEYFDTQIRLESYQKTRERFIQLLDQAETITEIVDIEKELSRINEEIDLLKGQMKRLNNLKDYSEINIRIDKKVTPGPLGWIFYGIYKVISWLFVW